MEIHLIFRSATLIKTQWHSTQFQRWWHPQTHHLSVNTPFLALQVLQRFLSLSVQDPPFCHHLLFQKGIIEYPYRWESGVCFKDSHVCQHQNQNFYHTLGQNFVCGSKRIVPIIINITWPCSSFLGDFTEQRGNGTWCARNVSWMTKLIKIMFQKQS